MGCPAGDEAVGGGVDDDASQTANVLETEPLVKSDFESVNALPSGTYGTANGYFPSGWGATVFLPATVTMTVAALCAPASALPALSLAIAAGAFPQTAECPTGDEWTDGGITQSGSQVITVASTPTGVVGSSPATGWTASVYNNGGTGSAVAECLTPPPPTVTTTTTTTTSGGATNRVIRLAGTDRVGTAIAISQNTFASRTAHAVVLARSDPGQFADALVGAALAVNRKGPLLLTPGSELDPRTLAEIDRVLPAGATVYVLGGVGAVSAGVATSLTDAGYTVVRYGGSDRFDTAAIVADQGLSDPAIVLEATGLDFPDALAAGAAAAHVGGAVLLTDGTTQAPETAAYLAAHTPTRLYAVGGQAATADPDATPIFGADRYATAAQVALTLFSSPTTFGAALGTNYPDALAGAAHIGAQGSPLLLVAASGALPAETADYLAGQRSITGTCTAGPLPSATTCSGS